MTNPTPTKTPTNTRKHRYTLTRLDLNALNAMLTRIGLRLDQVEAIGQNPDLKGRKVVNLGAGSEDDDAIRKDQIILTGFTTDNLTEGSTNLYLTDERIDDRVAALLVAGVGINLTYDDVANTLDVTVKQQAHEADAQTAHTITDPADTPADADALRDDLVANALPDIKAALDALGTKINNILVKIETAEVFASS